MTHVTTAHWRRLDCEGTDRCTLARADHGWMLNGLAQWGGPEEGELIYAVRSAPGWETLSADVTGQVAGRTVALKLVRDAGLWTMNGVPQPDLSGCVDVDLSFTPATNLLPLRRLTLGDVPVPVHAAWLMPDLRRLALLSQSYGRGGGADEVIYSSPRFEACLRVHPSGFVTHYPGLWEGWVDA